MKPVIDALHRCDGLATTAQLRALGIHRGQIDIAYMYGRIWRVRKGMWCLPELPRPVLRAQRVKGRLACVSALAFHGVIEDDGGPLHVSARVGQVSWHPVPERDDVVRHWSRTRLGGDRFAVDVETAWAQFALCRAVASGDVRLRGTDSL
ncbi:MAG: hypothetical protein AB7K08_14660 [Microbacteriaceae bacterium]